LTESQIHDLLIASEKGPVSMGKDPKTDQDVYCLTGRYGPYVQLGEVKEDAPKPRRASLAKGQEPKTITLDQALVLLSLPRELGMHPEKNKPVITNMGRFGPYVMSDGDFRSLKKEDDVYTVTFERAMELLREEKRARRGAQAIKEFGKLNDQTIELMDGKYGMYLKWGKVNATLPKEVDHEKLTPEQAIEIIKVRAEQVGESTEKKAPPVKKPAKAKAKKIDDASDEATIESARKASAKKVSKKK
jgi:DNA topoisomerase-1